MPPAEVRAVGKTESRRPVVLVGWKLRFGAGLERQALFPKRRRRIRLARHADLVQRVDRLAGVLVPHAQIQREVVFDSPVILEVVELVRLSVVDGDLTGGDDGSLWPILQQTVCCTGRAVRVEGESAIDIGQERYRIGQLANVNSHLELMEPEGLREVVRELIDGDDAALRQVCRGTDCCRATCWSRCCESRCRQC